ncbi:hypothetical protein AOQ88_00870 [Candidatus Riesia sp. GBBU]|nr:hypothetical protein AOQ88_00870 [Candidatus Riesia sp. GBBU]
MNILSIESSTRMCSVSVSSKERVSFRYFMSKKTDIKKILLMIEKCCKDTECTFNDIQLLVFGRGPGSFTGIRTVVGIIQGLAFWKKLPVIGVSSMRIMAKISQKKFNSKNILVVMDAKNDNLYFAEYKIKDNGDIIGEKTERVISFNEFFSITYKMKEKFIVLEKDFHSFVKKTKNLEGCLIYRTFPKAKNIFSLVKLKNFSNFEIIKPNYLENN